MGKGCWRCLGRVLGLASQFVARILKLVSNAQREATPGSEGPDSKCSRWFDSEEEAEESLVIIDMDSPKGALDGVLALKDQAPTRGSPDANQVSREALSEAAEDWAFLANLAMVDSRRARMVNRMELSSYV